MAPQTTGRRERLRQSTLAEIHAAARRLLTTQGSAAVTINAVARELGMSGPALYHYYASHDELVGAVTADFYRELAAELAATSKAHAADSPVGQLLATCRALRGWATTHRAEFGWMFASPLAAVNLQPDSPRQQAGQRFEQVLADQVVRIWELSPFPVGTIEDLAPSHREQLRAYSSSMDGRLPPEAVHVFLSCWIRLYGLLCLEVLRQLDYAFSDYEPIFEECLRDLAVLLGLEYEPPR